MLNKYQPLFLKYRPQAINELVGQNQVATTLANAIKYKRISHAYLFTGPRGTGKTSTARIFAKSLNCERGPTAEPCQTCTACEEIKLGISPSVFEIDAASNNSVDDARSLIERAPLSACGGRFKLYIVDECHMLTKEAFNALLKTIEEPPANVIFILATTEEHKVPPTIVSRCQKLMFRLINENTMAEYLEQIAMKENISMAKEAVAAISRRAAGGLRDALSLLDQVSLLGMDGQTVSTEDVLLLTGALPEEILISISEHILRKQSNETLSLLQELLGQGREAHLIAAELAKHMLNIAKAACLADEQKQSDLSSYQQALLNLCALVNGRELVQMIEELDRLEVACRRSAQPVMTLEIGLLSLCHRLDILELERINSRLEKLETGQGLEIAPMSDDKKASLIKETPPVKPIQSNPQPPQIKQEASQEKPKPEVAKEKPKPNSGSSPDTEVFWQNLLAELQKKHLPTFSLVSTHAFPVSLSENTLTIGVLVENFQKMIENKMDHIASACQPGLKIQVKLVANAEMAPKPISKIEPPDALESQPSTAALPVRRSAKQEVRASGDTAVQEAYQLFEGPGSRFIAPN